VRCGAWAVSSVPYRLDVMVSDAADGERTVRQALPNADVAVHGVGAGAPTLENTFVARLRRLEGAPSGKTTTIKMLCGLLWPKSGQVELAGARGRRSPAVRQQVGYMSQKFSLYDDLAIEENIDLFAGLYGVSPAERSARTRWVLNFAGLRGRGRQLTGSLPGGWKQRVAFGAAIMHEPRVRSSTSRPRAWIPSPGERSGP
jgi:ABC-type ATPase involved in cell division